MTDSQLQPMMAQAIAHELFANQCFAFTGEGRSHSPQCQHAAQQLEEWNISSHAALRAKVDELTVALRSEQAAIADEARRYASHYEPHSDGRNTFVLLAEWIEARKALALNSQHQSAPGE